MRINWLIFALPSYKAAGSMAALLVNSSAPHTSTCGVACHHQPGIRCAASAVHAFVWIKGAVSCPYNSTYLHQWQAMPRATRSVIPGQPSDPCMSRTATLIMCICTHCEVGQICGVAGQQHGFCSAICASGDRRALTINSPKGSPKAPKTIFCNPGLLAANSGQLAPMDSASMPPKPT